MNIHFLGSFDNQDVMYENNEVGNANVIIVFTFILSNL